MCGLINTASPPQFRFRRRLLGGWRTFGARPLKCVSLPQVRSRRSFNRRALVPIRLCLTFLLFSPLLGKTTVLIVGHLAEPPRSSFSCQSPDSTFKENFVFCEIVDPETLPRSKNATFVVRFFGISLALFCPSGRKPVRCFSLTFD